MIMMMQRPLPLAPHSLLAIPLLCVFAKRRMTLRKGVPVAAGSFVLADERDVFGRCARCGTYFEAAEAVDAIFEDAPPPADGVPAAAAAAGAAGGALSPTVDLVALQAVHAQEMAWVAANGVCAAIALTKEEYV
eukprot:gene2947-6577_t